MKKDFRLKWTTAYNDAIRKGLIEVRMKLTFHGLQVLPPQAASCCKEIFDLRIAAHLLTLKHFITWCMEHPDEVRRDFPELIRMIAEYRLSEDVK